MCSWGRGEDNWLWLLIVNKSPETWLYCLWIAGHLSILPTPCFYFHQLEWLSVPCSLHLHDWHIFGGSTLFPDGHVFLPMDVCTFHFYPQHFFPAFLCWIDNCPSLCLSQGPSPPEACPNYHGLGAFSSVPQSLCLGLHHTVQQSASCLSHHEPCKDKAVTSTSSFQELGHWKGSIPFHCMIKSLKITS